MAQKVLEVEALCKSYGEKKVLNNISFSVEQGKVVGFLGPNGAGKSTAMNIITGYISPGSGSVKLCGIDLLENPLKAKKKIGYLPEQPPLYADRTVNEYLGFAYDLKKCKGDKKAHIKECMSLVGIYDVRNRLIRNLSKGYRQRVGMAQAMLGYPEILILDEPTVGLDPSQIIEIRNVIRKLSRKSTIMLSTHILQEVTAVCDEVIIINHGQIMVSDSLEKLRHGESNRYRVSALCDESTVESVLGEIEAEYEILSASESETVFYVRMNRDERAELFDAFSAAGRQIVEISPSARDIESIFAEFTIS